MQARLHAVLEIGLGFRLAGLATSMNQEALQNKSHLLSDSQLAPSSQILNPGNQTSQTLKLPSPPQGIQGPLTKGKNKHSGLLAGSYHRKPFSEQGLRCTKPETLNPGGVVQPQVIEAIIPKSYALTSKPEVLSSEAL